MEESLSPAATPGNTNWKRDVWLVIGLSVASGIVVSPAGDGGKIEVSFFIYTFCFYINIFILFPSDYLTDFLCII